MWTTLVSSTGKTAWRNQHDIQTRTWELCCLLQTTDSAYWCNILFIGLLQQGGISMKKYEINWHENLNETELKILLEEWKGFFEVVEVSA